MIKGFYIDNNKRIARYKVGKNMLVVDSYGRREMQVFGLNVDKVLPALPTYSTK